MERQNAWIAHVEEMGAEEFWAQCVVSWRSLWSISEELGNFEQAEFYGDLFLDGFEMAVLCTAA